MRYGYFDDTAREYVITNPKTPVKWINYIGNLAFGGFVDQTGGTLICKNDPALNRITRYLALTPASDFKGESLYLRIQHQHGYRIFSPFFVPCLVPPERYECRVGLGYTRILTQTWGIETDVTIFVPLEGGREIRDIRITNRSDQSVVLDAIPVVEYTHFDALRQLTNADWVPQTMQSRAVKQADGRVILIQCAFMKRGLAENYFTCNMPASSFETDRKIFLGDNEYGSWQHPLSLELAELPCSEALRGDNIAALLVSLGSLQPGETRRLITQLGQESDVNAAIEMIGKYYQPEVVEAAFAELGRQWQTVLKRVQVLTPDPAFNSMLNVFNPRQCDVTLNWSRYLSMYQLGYGERGIGFRDSSQDIMGALPLRPLECRALLEKLLQVQKRDGSAMHQFNPLTMEGSQGDAHGEEDGPRYYSDDALWIVLAVTAYLKETGDFDFLKLDLSYAEKDADGQALETAPVWVHLQQAVAFTRNDRGAHGLPHLGFADWNDTVNLAAGAESLFSAALYGRALLELIGLSKWMGNQAQADAYQMDYEQMKTACNLHGWDGAWYRSYFDTDGRALGSIENEAGQIYAYSQAWPVIAGFADSERARQALDALQQRLDTRFGIKLSAPGYQRFDPALGGVTTYPPGAKENGGIFLHVNPWVIIAETMIGRGEMAYRYYAQINPAEKNEIEEIFECEPYVYPQNILGNEHAQFGLARNSWLSGTASWMYQAGIQYILGVRPEYDGLTIDPCIPSAWEGFSAKRVFRGAHYHIEVMNPTHLCQGVNTVVVDGSPIHGQKLPLFADGEQHHIIVTLGTAGEHLPVEGA